jgi:NAD(P)-dependent dehydrogenase (short-subunit alcohol dehydrogenase family)
MGQKQKHIICKNFINYVLVFGTCETCTIEEQQMSMNVNYFGSIRVLQAVLPHIRRRRSCQLIQISSVEGYEAFPHWETYVSTKFALEGLTESLASQLAPWNIRVSLVSPGNVKTEAPIRAPIGSRSLKDTPVYQRYIMQARQQRIEANEQALLPIEVVKVIEEILNSPHPHLRYPVGDFAKKRAEDRFRDPSGDSYVAFKNQLLASTYSFNPSET